MRHQGRDEVVSGTKYQAPRERRNEVVSSTKGEMK